MSEYIILCSVANFTGKSNDLRQAIMQTLVIILIYNSGKSSFRFLKPLNMSSTRLIAHSFKAVFISRKRAKIAHRS